MHRFSSLVMLFDIEKEEVICPVISLCFNLNKLLKYYDWWIQ